MTKKEMAEKMLYILDYILVEKFKATLWNDDRITEFYYDLLAISRDEEGV